MEVLLKICLSRMEVDDESDDNEVMEIPRPQNFPVAGPRTLIPIEDEEVQEVVEVNGRYLTQQELAAEIQERQDTPIPTIEDRWIELEDGRHMVFFRPGIRPPTPLLGEQPVRVVDIEEMPDLESVDQDGNVVSDSEDGEGVADYQEEVERQREETYQEANAHADRLVISGLALPEYQDPPPYE